MGKKYGFSFSWKRALGLSAAKGRLSRKIGIPSTRSGRQRKVGRAAGCLVIFGIFSTMGVPFALAAALGYFAG
jgi:hypothetical protein